MKNSRRKNGAMLMLLGIGALGLWWFRPRALADAEVRVFQTPEKSRVNDVAWSPDGKTLLLGVEIASWPVSPPGEAQFWDVTSGTLKRTLSLPKETATVAYRVNFSSDGREVSVDHQIHVLKDGQVRVVKDAGFHTGLMFSPDGKTLASASKNVLILWNRNEVKPRAMLGDAASLQARLVPQPLVPFIDSAAWSPDSQFIVTGHTNGEVQLWDVAKAKLARTLGKGGSTDVAWSPDGHTVAATNAREIVLWDVRDGREIQRFAAPGPTKYSMFSLAFSPDGKTLAAGGPRFYEISRKELEATPFRGHSGPPTHTTKGEINLWDVSSGRLTTTMQAGKWIRHLIFSPDGKQLATAGDDNTARLWSVPPQ